VGQPFGFTGREHELESGLVYARDRYLSPATGRWSQADRLGDIDGPNMYGYASASPTRFGDPSGQFIVEVAVRSLAGQIWQENLVEFIRRAGCDPEPETRAVWITYAGFALMMLAVTASGTKGYDSFSSFKSAMGPAGAAKQWHHIVPQYAPNVAKFGAKRIHNVQNVVAIPEKAHRAINAYMNSKQPFTGGRYVYEWLSRKSFEEQFEFALEVMAKALQGTL